MTATAPLDRFTPHDAVPAARAGYCACGTLLIDGVHSRFPGEPTSVLSPAGVSHFYRGRADGHTRCGFPVTFGAGRWVTRNLGHTTVSCLRCSHIPAAPVAAAEGHRDEVTVPVEDGDDDGFDVAQCGIFGHEFEGGRCAVCGQPDPSVEPATEVELPLAEGTGMVITPAPAADRIAAVLADAAASGVTLHSEPGGFGVALAVLGFGEGQRGDSWSEGPYWAFDHDTQPVRVVVYTDDGDRVALIGFDAERPAAKLISWKASFDGATPQHAVLTALAAALGVLPVTRTPRVLPVLSLDSISTAAADAGFSLRLNNIGGGVLALVDYAGLTVTLNGGQRSVNVDEDGPADVLVCFDGAEVASGPARTATEALALALVLVR